VAGWGSASLERGATVPFTSPLLQQARIRLGLGGTREIVLCNPSGGPGWYVGPWDGVAEMARATVHDRLVYKRIEEKRARSARLTSAAPVSRPAPGSCSNARRSRPRIS
jgi:hypothetical protein